MSNAEVRTVTEDAPLERIVHLMVRHQINRVLVGRDGKLVGIGTRANLLHALASVAAETKPGPTSDTSIRERLYSVFFQAEDGIRDDLVTGVQTCALPI